MHTYYDYHHYYYNGRKNKSNWSLRVLNDDPYPFLNSACAFLQSCSRKPLDSEGTLISGSDPDSCFTNLHVLDFLIAMPIKKCGVYTALSLRSP